jgi:periplasmic copper chaperone A
MRKLQAFLAACVALAVPGLPPSHEAIAHEATKANVTVTHPWVRATPGGAVNGAAFLEIKTGPGAADRLIEASSPVATRVEIHTHIVDGNVMRMRRVENLPVAGGGSVVLKPGGDHIMLMGLRQPLKEGELVKLTLVFEKAGAIDIEATVEPIGAAGPHGMDHQPGHAPEAGGAHKH